MNAVVRFLFWLVWWRRLRGLRLVRVTGWRSCLYDNMYGQRVRATWMFSKSNKVICLKNEKGKRGEWRLRPGRGRFLLAIGGTVRRA